jgi:hypothetical protein
VPARSPEQVLSVAPESIMPTMTTPTILTVWTTGGQHGQDGLVRSGPVVLDSLPHTLGRTADPDGPRVGLAVIDIEGPEFTGVLDHALDPVPIGGVDDDPSDVRMG